MFERDSIAAAFALSERRLAETESRVSAVMPTEEPNNRIAVATGLEIYILEQTTSLLIEYESQKMEIKKGKMR